MKRDESQISLMNEEIRITRAEMEEEQRNRKNAQGSVLQQAFSNFVQLQKDAFRLVG